MSLSDAIRRFGTLSITLCISSLIAILVWLQGCSKKEDPLTRKMKAERYELIVLFDSLKTSIGSMAAIDDRLKAEHDAAVGNSRDNEDHIKLEIRHAELIEAGRVLLEDDARLIALHERLETEFLKGEMSEKDALAELESLQKDEKKLIRERRAIEAEQADIIADHEEMMRDHAAHRSYH